MNKIIKFSTKDQNIWVSSDFHYNHRPKWNVPIWTQRGFNSPEEMNIAIIKSVNDNVQYNDILFHVGDLTLNTSRQQFDSFISSLNCQRIVCLWGNHPNPMYSIYKEEVKNQFGLDPNEYEIFPLKYKNIEFWGDYAEICVDGQILVLFHYPILSWNHLSHGSICCYGHEHHKLSEVQWIKENHLTGRTLDVGFDGFKRPINFKEILQLMKNKRNPSIGNHGKDN